MNKCVLLAKRRLFVPGTSVAMDPCAHDCATMTLHCHSVLSLLLTPMQPKAVPWFDLVFSVKLLGSAQLPVSKSQQEARAAMTTAWHRRSEDGANFPSRSFQWPCAGQRAELKGLETCLFFLLGIYWDGMKTSLKTCGFGLCQSCYRPPPTLCNP